MSKTCWCGTCTNTSHIVLTLVQPVQALLPNAECQLKEQLVLVIENLRYDQAGDRTRNLPLWRQTFLQPSHSDQYEALSNNNGWSDFKLKHNTTFPICDPIVTQALRGMDPPSRETILTWMYMYMPPFLLGATLKGKNLPPLGENSFL